MTKILKVEKKESGNTIIWERLLKDEILGTLKQRLAIEKSGDAVAKVVMRTWGDRMYWETRLEKVVLTKPAKWKGRDVNVVLVYTHGHEGEGNNHWYGVDIVPNDPSHIDAVLSKIVDFDTFGDTVRCLEDTCREMSYFNVVECDISRCLQQRQ